MRKGRRERNRAVRGRQYLLQAPELRAAHKQIADLRKDLPAMPTTLKRLHRLIVLSATYRQSSKVTPKLRERDAENKLLARGPSTRLEAELVRDMILQASGLLSRKIGGPSVFPPQPPGITTEGAYGALEWKTSQGEDRYRRGLYTFSKRTAPYAMFTTFDTPSGESCVARHEVSNTPLQALTYHHAGREFRLTDVHGRVLKDILA